jgi:hypothetical protein
LVLSNVPALGTLDLCGPIYDSTDDRHCQLHIDGAPSLRDVNLRYTTISALLAGEMGAVESMSVSCSRIDGVPHHKWHHLRALCLRNCTGTPEALRALVGARELRRLQFIDTPIALTDLTPQSGIEELWLEATGELTEGDSDRLGSLERLRKLTLSRLSYRGSAVAHLAGVRMLEDLSLDCGSQVATHVIEQLHALPHVREVSIECQDITAQQIGALRSLENVVYLNGERLESHDDH